MVSLIFFFIQSNIADFSGNQWITSFQDSAEAILATTAEQLGKYQQDVRFKNTPIKVISFQ